MLQTGAKGQRLRKGTGRDKEEDKEGNRERGGEEDREGDRERTGIRQGEREWSRG